MALNFEKITDIEWDGIDHGDAPDYCDAFIVSAKIDGADLTEAELDELNEDSQLVYELLMKHLY